MTIHERIEIIKLKGENVEYGILSLPNDKYMERFIIFFEDRYYLIFEILDTFEDTFYYEDISDFDEENTARDQYDNLLIEHNGTIYE